MSKDYRPEKDPVAIFLASIFTLFIFLGIFNSRLLSGIIPESESVKEPECSVSGVGFHTIRSNSRYGSDMSIKFNSDGRFNYTDILFNEPKWTEGTWEQQGNEIITTNDNQSPNITSIGQQNTYIYDCNTLYAKGDDGAILATGYVKDEPLF